jgi:hypothetical protein
MDVIEIILANETFGELRTQALLCFKDNPQEFQVWACGLAQAIVPTTFHFLKLIKMCFEFYDLDHKVVKHKSSQHEHFFVTQSAISEFYCY